MNKKNEIIIIYIPKKSQQNKSKKNQTMKIRKYTQSNVAKISKREWKMEKKEL